MLEVAWGHFFSVPFPVCTCCKEQRTNTMARMDAFQLPESPGGMLMLAMTALGALLLMYLMYQPARMVEEDDADESTPDPPPPPRNFTIEQLHEFDGRDEATPAYVALRGEVFDVSSKPEHYKQGGGYHLFAGHDASYSLATASLDPADLERSWADLNMMEKDTLDGWVEKYKHYSGYPIVGKVVQPPEPREFSLEELRPFDGTSETPEGHAAPPIYVGVRGKVYDMSYGGAAMYGPGKSYNLFAGRDASVALAKMSFAPENLDNPDMSLLDEADMKVLKDWDEKMAKKYPVIGTIANSAP